MLLPLHLAVAGALAVALPPAAPAPEAAAAAADPFAPAAYGAPLPTGLLALQDAAPAPKGPQTGWLAKWDGAVNFGGSISSGNTDVRTAQADLLGVRENKEGDQLVDRWTVKGYWNYADEKDPVTDERNLARRQAGTSAKYDHTITKDLYGYASTTLDTDKIANLKLRTTGGAGLGYQVYDTERFDLAGEAGLAYVTEDYGGPVGADAADTEFVSARVAYNLTWLINEDLTARQFVEAFPSLENPDDVFARIDSRLVYTLTKSMTASLGHLWLFDNTPVAGNERSDHIISLNIGWVF